MDAGAMETDTQKYGAGSVALGTVLERECLCVHCNCVTLTTVVCW